jgi:hypothetical protein
MNRKIFILPLIFFVLLAGCIDEKTPETGTIQFTSSPTGAQVYLDSQFRGTTPSTLTGIEPGNHTIEFRYTGYQSWSSPMLVSSGPNNVFVALSPQAGSTPQTSPATLPTESSGVSTTPVSVTMNVEKSRMVIGDSNIFSGTATGSKNVLLTLFGPGAYADGLSLSPPDVNDLHTWSYTWNPGSKLMAGTYIIMVTDPEKRVTVKKEFTVVGGGEVTVTSSKAAAARGDTLQFSGLCTTGASNIQLILYGPDQYAGGIQLGTFSVLADKNWNFRYTLDNTMPTGLYTLYIYDVPQTASDTTQFTVGYAS